MRSLFILLGFFTTASCSNNANKSAENDSSPIRELPADSSETDIVKLTKKTFMFGKWITKKTIAKNPRITDQYLNGDTLIIGLNEMFSNIKLEKIRQSNYTLYTQIKDAAFLTEQMGSSGPELYIAQAVFNLTSIKGVNYVKIDFEMGSHATPDIWSRENFKDYKQVQ